LQKYSRYSASAYLRATLEIPVMFSPGRARLATNPLATGSLSCAITMEIVLVALWQHE
jgi:hypothetical protein